MKNLLLLFILFFTLSANAQLYYPPINGSNWDTVSPTSLGWCSDSLSSLNQFLDDKNTKAFVVLKDGKIAVEWYFDSFTQDSFWYWASAGKTMTATLTGIAQQQGLLNINDTTSKHLGVGWTNCSIADEEKITLRHQMTMTTGFQYLGVPFECTDDTCLNCLNTPGTEWYYHNGPYTLLTNVIENASGQNLNAYYTNELGSKIGAGGAYVWLGDNRIFFSRARAMARFGLLMLSKGNWNGNQIVDSSWVNEMTTQSQTINESYGYLWWLNGQNSYKLPVTTATYPGKLMPEAPDDLFAGLGKNDQKLYIVPSQNLVVIRLGNSASGSSLATSSFDNELWKKIGNLGCPTSLEIIENISLTVYPNPTTNWLGIESDLEIEKIIIYDLAGKLVEEKSSPTIDISHLNAGRYSIEVQFENDKKSYSSFIKI